VTPLVFDCLFTERVKKRLPFLLLSFPRSTLFPRLAEKNGKQASPGPPLKRLPLCRSLFRNLPQDGPSRQLMAIPCQPWPKEALMGQKKTWLSSGHWMVIHGHQCRNDQSSSSSYPPVTGVVLDNLPHLQSEPEMAPTNGTIKSNGSSSHSSVLFLFLSIFLLFLFLWKRRGPGGAGVLSLP
jgi:hypothetical protein